MTPRAVGLALLVLAFAVLLALVELHWGPLHRLDVRTDASLHRSALADPGLTRWWRAVSNVLSPTVLRAVALVAAVVLWLTSRRRAAVFVAVAVAGAALLEAVAKELVGRARPVFAQPVAHAVGASFPSGHAMTSLTAFGVLVLLVAPRRRLPVAALAAVAVAAVGFSRLALGVHYLSDVVAGWLLAAAWLLAVHWFLYARTAAGTASGNDAGRAEDAVG